jgi:16S rRNA C1402 N4-methylase RsmH
MTPPRPTQLAQILLRNSIHEGDTVIDGTAGNGHDTVFLAECVRLNGRVLAFDIQEQAIRSAKAAVIAANFSDRVEFHQLSHTKMAEYAEQNSVAAIMFNLGYLPGDDHHFTTQTEETLTAMAIAANLLKPGGILSVVCYPGHPEGALEAELVEVWMSSLTSDGWCVAKYAMLGMRKPAPFLLMGRKNGLKSGTTLCSPSEPLRFGL